MIGNLEQAVHDLTAKCAGLEQADMAIGAVLKTANGQSRLQEEEVTRALDAARKSAPVGTPVLIIEEPPRATSEWAARLLEISTRDAETIVTEARDEAGRIVARARSEAAQTIQARLSKLHAREDAVEEMAEEQRKQLDRMRNETLLELEGRRDELDAEVRRSGRDRGPHAAGLLLPRATGAPRAATPCRAATCPRDPRPRDPRPRDPRRRVPGG